MKLDQPHPSKNLSKNCCLPGCIEGARLQLCRKKPGMTRAIASEGCSLVQVSIQILVFFTGSKRRSRTAGGCTPPAHSFRRKRGTRAGCRVPLVPRTLGPGKAQNPCERIASGCRTAGVCR